MNQPPMQPQQFDQQQQVPQQQLQGRPCPFCQTLLHPAAIVCATCRRDMPWGPPKRWPVWQQLVVLIFVSAIGYAIMQAIR